MIEKNLTLKNNSYAQFQKKITSYLDGSLSADDRSEFEAFVRTHPEFEEQIKVKEEELMTLKSKIPAASLSREGLEALESEMKQSVLNLLKEEPKNLLESMKSSWEEWINR